MKPNFRPQRSPRRLPRGTSLIEMVVVFGLMAVVGGLVGQILFSLSRAEQAATRDLLLERRLVELAWRFRDDVHTAAGCQLDAAATTLVLTRPGGDRITYRLQGDTIQRRSLGDRPTRETLALPGCALQFLVGDVPAPFVELVITRPWPQVLEAGLASAPRATVRLRALRRANQLPFHSETP